VLADEFFTKRIEKPKPFPATRWKTPSIRLVTENGITACWGSNYPSPDDAMPHYPNYCYKIPMPDCGELSTTAD
jgi:hypothetical protein